jgi:hypothetical protein
MQTHRLRNARAHELTMWTWIAAIVGFATVSLLVWMVVAWLLAVAD